jgi:hypothetical protein
LATHSHPQLYHLPHFLFILSQLLLDMSSQRKDEEAASHMEPEKGRSASKASSSTGDHEHAENAPPRGASVAAKLTNPLTGMSEEQILADVDVFVDTHGLSHEKEIFRKGALLSRVAQRENGFETVHQLSEDEKALLRRETTHRWSQPFQLYFLVILCAGSAIVQGMDQTAVNGAQQFYFDEFNIPPEAVWQRGLLNGAPYLASAAIGCWTNRPLNKYG